MKKSIIGLSLIASAALAQSYNLGQVNVEERNKSNINMFEKTISSDEISRDNSLDISEALDNISGVNQDIQGGRGESTIYIRGFNSRKVGVFIDGVPIYVPYDGNFDYGRFLTTDISQIDVSKGYSSVVYGGNTMGGVVNIISKKPTKEFEGNIKTNVIFDSNMKMARHIESLNLGTMQKNGFYTQVGASYSKQDHFRMSDDFKGNSHQAKGDRLRSESEDKKISLKVGYVASDNSEIAINYSNQQGEKQQPPVTDLSFAQEKYWDWPKVDKESVSIVGQKNFNNSYIKALAYYDSSKNNLNQYTNNTFSSLKKKNENEDYSYGTRLEYGLASDSNFFKTAANYKKDSHKSYDIGTTNNNKSLNENYEDHTISLGVENIYNITPKLELLTGLSYDMRKADKLYDINPKYLNMMELEKNDSFSPQAALVYSIDDDSKLKVSISKKTYMPSMKDRYSRGPGGDGSGGGNNSGGGNGSGGGQGTGGGNGSGGGQGTGTGGGEKVPNPSLKNEEAIHYEISYQRYYNNLNFGLAGFFTRVDDAIQNVTYNNDKTKKQNQNIGSFDHRGIELDLEYAGNDYKIGTNYTFISIKSRNDVDNKHKIVDVPKHQIFFFAEKEIGAGFSIYGNMKFRKGAYENKMDKSYAENPTTTTFDLKAIYKANKSLIAQVGVKNIGDKLIRYDMAYPMAGREYFTSLEYKF